ncbi:MAG: metal-dependent phosphohydrolase [Frankiaceae bacterium]
MGRRVTLLQRWQALGGQDDVGRELLARYAEPHRHYHDRQHLTEVLTALDLLGASNTARLAAWFHDAVYDPRRGDNEDRSASLAVELLGKHLPTEQVADVARLVRLTAAHDPAAGDADGAALCDADLAILGAHPTRYGQYATAVRAEYAHVPAADFARGRAAILRDLLNREVLYRTLIARSRWEQAARANVSRELDRWG